eukprot:3035474-Prymnesium_polylepis.1
MKAKRNELRTRSEPPRPGSLRSKTGTLQLHAHGSRHAPSRRTSGVGRQGPRAPLALPYDRSAPAPEDPRCPRIHSNA